MKGALDVYIGVGCVLAMASLFVTAFGVLGVWLSNQEALLFKKSGARKLWFGIIGIPLIIAPLWPVAAVGAFIGGVWLLTRAALGYYEDGDD